MNYFKKKKDKKEAKQLLQAAKHARNMREDIADQRELETLRQAEDTFKYIIFIKTSKIMDRFFSIKR